MEIVTINDIPLYNNDDETNDGIPNAVEQLKSTIAESSGLLISTPEYNHGIPGVLKNTLDWLTRPPEDSARVFGQRKIGIIGASPSQFGTTFAQTAWLPILRCLHTHPYFDAELFVSYAHTMFNEQGHITDKTLQERLARYIEGFCHFLTQ